MPGYPQKKGGLLLGTWLVDRVNLFFRLRRYIKWVQERWFILAGCVVVSTGVTVYRAVNTPDMFRAVSKIGVAPRIQTPYKNQAEYQEEVSTFFDKQVEYMTSDQVMGKVREQLHDSIPKMEGFVCNPSAFKGPVSIVMQVDSMDFNFARQFASRWAHEFIAFKSQMRQNAMGTSAQEIRDEIKRRQDALDAAREALTEFENKNKIGSIREAGAAAQQRLDELLYQLQEIKIRRQRLENRKPEEIADGAIAPTVPPLNAPTSTNGAGASPLTTTDPLAVVESAKYGEWKIRLRSLEAEQQRRAATLQPAHPYMVQVAQEIASNKQQIKYFLDQIEERRLAQIAELKRDEDGLLPIIDEARQEVLAKSAIQYQFAHLTEDEANIKQIVDSLQKQAQSIAAAPSEEGFFSIDVDGAGDPRAISPNRPKMVFGGLMFGAVLGFALIYLLGRLDDRLELAEDIEAELEERIVGQIPLVSKKLNKNKRLLVSDLDKHNMFAESLRGVRSSIMFGPGQNEAGGRRPEGKVFIVTSAAPGDGKTTITTNLAITLAFAGHRVLLVDGDLRRGNINAYFGWEREKGLAELLDGKVKWADIVRQTDIPSLSIISTGQLPPNPGELLIGPYTKPFINEVRALFEYVIFDCPPLTSIDDAFSLSRLADGVIFVIMSGQTSMRFAKTALASVRQRGGTILGLVLNGIRPDNPYYYYQQYYYSYYTVEEPENGSDEPSIVKTSKTRRRSSAKDDSSESFDTRKESGPSSGKGPAAAADVGKK